MMRRRLAVAVFLLSLRCLAQQATVDLRGFVTDPAGAAIQGAFNHRPKCEHQPGALCPKS